MEAAEAVINRRKRNWKERRVFLKRQLDRRHPRGERVADRRTLFVVPFVSGCVLS